MATPISARRPYLVVESNTSIIWNIISQYDGEPVSALEYRIVKTSYSESVQEDLSVNISPFAKDRFEHITRDFPTSITLLPNGQQVLVKITPEYSGITQEFLATDGWDKPTSAVPVPVSTTEGVRNIYKNSKQYLTTNLATTQTVQWATQTGQLVQETNPLVGIDDLSMLPVLHPSLIIGNDVRIITVLGRNSSNQVIWSINYEVVCPYNESFTVGFINRYGVWEFFDVSGRVIKGVTTTRESYRRFDSGNTQAYSVNGSNSYEVNTGLVSKEFERTLEELSLSEHIVLYNGISDQAIPLILQNTGFIYKGERADKVMEYSMLFSSAGTIIDTVAGPDDITGATTQSF